jgi:hypothetical protein
MSRSRILIFSAAAVFVAAVVVLILPIEIPNTVDTYGKVLPAKEWVLLRGDNGMIVSVLRDNASGVVRQYNVMQLERGEALSFSTADFTASSAVRKGDTVAWTTSTDLEVTLATLRGALAVAEAALEAAKTGQKTSLVEEAERNLAYSRKAVEEQEALHRRQAELHAKHMVSDEAYELSKDRLELLRINVTIAEAQLAAVATGARPAEIRQRVEEITAIRGELNAVVKRSTFSSHIAPISGKLTFSRAADTLLIVEDTTARLLFMPVPLRDLAFLSKGAAVQFSSGETDARGEAVTLTTDGDVQYVEGHAMRLLSARVTRCSSAPPRGLITACSIALRPLTLASYLQLHVGRVLE